MPFVGESGRTLAAVSRQTSYQSPFDDSAPGRLPRALRRGAQARRAVTLRNRFYFTELAWDIHGHAHERRLRPSPTATRTSSRTHDSSTTGRSSWATSSRWRPRSTRAPSRHDLLGGVELTRLTDEFVQDVALLDPIDLLNPVEQPGATPPAPSPPSAWPATPRPRVRALRRRPPGAVEAVAASPWARGSTSWTTRTRQRHRAATTRS